jgi:hypothetical protein
MRLFAFALALLTALSLTLIGSRFFPENAAAVSVPESADAGVQIGQESGESHDVAVNYVSIYGPGAVNLSDTKGRYMWVVTEVQNHSDHPEAVALSINIDEPVPLGCERQIDLIMPGRPSLHLDAGQTFPVMWRVSYVCHGPAMPSVIGQTVTVGVTHTASPEANLANNSGTASKAIIIR